MGGAPNQGGGGGRESWLKKEGDEKNEEDKGNVKEREWTKP